MTRQAPRDPAVTSRMMSRVRDRDSKAELALRRALHAEGVRYRLHAQDLPGKPDIVIRCRRLAVFVDGDMWHGNPAEPARRGRRDFADIFPTRTEWWVAKIARTVARDQQVTAQLKDLGYTVIRIWESDIKKDVNGALGRVLGALGKAL